MNKEQQIIDSWHDNASPWTKAIRNKEITSRTLVTNQAIVDTVMKYEPRTALDVGCGEGWLSHTLYRKGVQIMGIDVVPALIKKAKVGLERLKGAEQLKQDIFAVCSYQALIQDSFNAPHLFDAIVFNFSLFGEGSTEQVLMTVKGLLEKKGLIFIQTLHPVIACGDQAYQDSWREGSWAGFSKEFTNPAPWYFRTLQGWIQLLKKVKLKLEELIEPLHPETKRPASVIFVCRK